MPVGRPAIVDEDVLHKLEEAFAMGCTDLEACVYANISKSTLYNYQQEHPDFLERKDELKENPVLKARKTVIDSLGEVENAKWFLERKNKKEFSQRSEFTGADGKPLILPAEVIDKHNLNEPHQSTEGNS